MDFVLYWIDRGEFEFERHNYPYVYHTTSVTEEIWDNGRKADEKIRDITEAWVPISELPKDKKQILNKMIKEVN
mgnify:FL=1